MAHVITSLCLRHEGCVAICPVNCIVPGVPIEVWPYAYIDPHACTDCGLCVPMCPYHAIWPQGQLPPALKADCQLNAAFFESGPGYAARNPDRRGGGPARKAHRRRP